MSSETIVTIVPLYNGHEFIRASLESVFRQSRAPDEVVVVDDGSTDDSAQEVLRLIEGRPNARLFTKSNGGQSSARNFAVSKSKSTLLAFLDQDDVWYADHLKVLAEPFELGQRSTLGWAYSNMDEIDRSGALVARSVLDWRRGEHPKVSVTDFVERDLHILPSASLVRRDAFEAVGGFDERLIGYEDDDLFLRLFLAGYQHEYVSAALSQWRIYPGSTSSSERMSVSRAIYASKLLAALPSMDLPRGERTRINVARRFSKNYLGDMCRAIEAKDANRLRRSTRNLQQTRRLLPKPENLALAVLETALSWYPLSRALFATGILPAAVALLRTVRRSRK